MSDKPAVPTVIKEFKVIAGKYRIRLIKKPKGLVLDIREFVNNGTFEGFTRRGIYLDRAGLEDLRSEIDEVLKEMS